ncbi:MAG: NgoBV family restriction endonuclease [Synergistaceae bacterium]|nr:NgoBV family restriction endonuclease [Synergistaceae bacterium]
MKRQVTAQEIYQTLVNRYRIKSLDGIIKFHMGDVSIAVKRRDVIGGILQEWLEKWLRLNKIDFLSNPQLTMPPDIYLNRRDLTTGWLEVKAFNRNDTPRFSIAEFRTFANELIEHPYHLEADYLIFGYSMNEETGKVKIQDIWLKKIWEITKAMATWPLTVQFKNQVLHELRPCKWFSKRQTGRVFDCVEDFLSAFEETVYQNPDTRFLSAQWKNNFKNAYKKYYGTDINFPKWDEIKHKYMKI